MTNDDRKLLTKDDLRDPPSKSVRVMQVKTDELLLAADRMGLEFEYEDGIDDGGMY